MHNRKNSANKRGGLNGAKLMMVLGAVLILSALSLLAYNHYADAKAGKEAEDMLAGVEAAIGEELSVAEIDGYEYIGYLTLPTLELKLPVMANWDYYRLNLAPCRQFGTAEEGDLVIAAHNFKSHFGRLKELEAGDEVCFTDMSGKEYSYFVADMQTLQPTQVDEVQNSDYELVLYTCTVGGASRVTIFCKKASLIGY